MPEYDDDEYDLSQYQEAPVDASGRRGAVSMTTVPQTQHQYFPDDFEFGAHAGNADPSGGYDMSPNASRHGSDFSGDMDPAAIGQPTEAQAETAAYYEDVARRDSETAAEPLTTPHLWWPNPENPKWKTAMDAMEAPARIGRAITEVAPETAVGKGAAIFANAVSQIPQINQMYAYLYESFVSQENRNAWGGLADAGLTAATIATSVAAAVQQYNPELVNETALKLTTVVLSHLTEGLQTYRNSKEGRRASAGLEADLEAQSTPMQTVAAQASSYTAPAVDSAHAQTPVYTQNAYAQGPEQHRQSSTTGYSHHGSQAGSSNPQRGSQQGKHGVKQRKRTK